MTTIAITARFARSLLASLAAVAFIKPIPANQRHAIRQRERIQAMQTITQTVRSTRYLLTSLATVAFGLSMGKTQRHRHLGRIAAVGAGALLLTGSMAATTEARPAHPANAAIQVCMELGGDPYVYEYWNVWGVACDIDNTVSTGTRNNVATAQISATGDRGNRTTFARHHRDHKRTTHARKRG